MSEQARDGDRNRNQTKTYIYLFRDSASVPGARIEFFFGIILSL